MPVANIVMGGFVGMLFGLVFRETLTGRDYGAGQWQRAKDKQFVSNLEGFVRWLALPVMTGLTGAVLTPFMYAAFLKFIASASLAVIFTAVGLVIGGLYLVFKTQVLA